ncbi:hypothetical protein GJ496_002599 [Pomphorhynchus laevis]|nr:hypothetical protein GJ496_002599 [Pomphorhynchus laevis]
MHNYKQKNTSDVHKHAGYRKASHAFIFWRTTQHPSHYRVLVIYRFDGHYGFPGGLANHHESPINALNRELKEEINLSIPIFQESDLLNTNVSHTNKLNLYSFGKIISEDLSKVIIKDVFKAEDMGKETLGVISMPLKSMTGLQNLSNLRFISNSQNQLIHMINRLGIVLPFSHTSIPNYHFAKAPYKVKLAVFVQSKRKLFHTIPTNLHLLTFISKTKQCVLPTFYGQDKNEVVYKANLFLQVVNSYYIHPNEVDQSTLLYREVKSEYDFFNTSCRQAYTWMLNQTDHIGLLTLAAFDIWSKDKIVGLSFFLQNQPHDFNVRNAMGTLVGSYNIKLM